MALHLKLEWEIYITHLLLLALKATANNLNPSERMKKIKLSCTSLNAQAKGNSPLGLA